MRPLPPEVPPPAYVPPPSPLPAKEIMVLPWAAPWRWLSLGWRDLLAHPGISLFFGLAFCAMALSLAAVFHTQPEFTMTMASGCLLIGPFLALGLYHISRQRELGLPPGFVASLLCWRARFASMGLLVGVLLLMELLWGRASLVMIALFFNDGKLASQGIVAAVLDPANLEFVLAYAGVGSMFVTLVFGISVVSLPMILDRDTDTISACVTSLEVLANNTGVMLLWGILIVCLVTAALLTPWCIGLVPLGPVLGHASWHAYRDSVRWL